MKRSLCIGACAVAAFAVTPARAANPPCSNIPGVVGTPVYITGSTAVKPALKEISPTLAALADPTRIIYQSVSSCTGLSDVATSHGETATGIYWAADGTEKSCDVDAVAGQVPDIGVSDVYSSTCDGVTVPATGFKDYLGAVQVMTFIVPPSSKENVISAEAASVIYGFGGQGTMIAPWTDPSSIVQRPDTSGTRRMIAKAIGLENGKWHASEKKGSTDILAAVHNSDATNPNGGIGTISADFADTNRTGASAIKILAFQPRGESCAYYPDSTNTALDKRNVRSGKYPIWGPIHLTTKVDGGGTPISARVATVLSYFTGAGLDVATKKTMLDNQIAAHTVPWCAMNVTRSGEVGAATQAELKPDEPCGCYFEFKATGLAPSSCVACTDNGPCGSGQCRYGYCEAK